MPRARPRLLPGRFLPMPDDLAATPFLVLWEHNVFAFLLAEGRITEKVVEQMRSWKHSGNVDTPLRYVLQAGCLAGARLSVDKSVHVSAGDPAAMQRVVQYMVRCIRPGQSVAEFQSNQQSPNQSLVLRRMVSSVVHGMLAGFLEILKYSSTVDQTKEEPHANQKCCINHVHRFGHVRQCQTINDRRGR